MNTEPELLAVTLFVSDVPASVAFYSALGITFDSDLHGGVGPVVIGLHPSSERWPTTRTALSLTVPSLGAVTAAFGALGGKLGKDAVDKEFQNQVRAALEPGTSALFLIVEQMTPDKAIDALSKFGGTVIKTSLSSDVEAELQAHLHGDA